LSATHSTSPPTPATLDGADRPRCGITAVVPCYNEIEAIDRAYREIRAALRDYDAELLFVDDGSTDGTLERIRQLAERDPAVRYLALARNFGQEAAFSAGFKYASKPWTVQLDADLQWPPAEIPALLVKALEGYDAVFAVRERRQDPWLRRAGSSAQHWLARRVLGIELPRGASAFRVVRTAVARKLVALDLPLPYFIATLPRMTASWATVPTAHHPRVHGRSKWRLGRLVGHSLDLFLGFSTRPLALPPAAALLGIGMAVVALPMAMGGLADNAALGALSLVVGVLILTGLAVVAGYLLRLSAGQRRPARFYIREANLAIEPEDDLYEHTDKTAGARL
jgi:hypothetical protein